MMPSMRQLRRVLRLGSVDELRLLFEGPRLRAGTTPGAFVSAAFVSAAVMRRTKGGLSLLQLACCANRFDMAAALVREFGFPVNDRNPKSGNTAVIHACFYDKADTVVFLIRELGADPHAVNNQGGTALHMACYAGHTKLALMLVRKLGLHLEATENEGLTPTGLAVLGGHTATLIALITQLGARVDTVIVHGSTTLHQAAGMGFTDTALALIRYGANVQSVDNYGETPLHYACVYGRASMVSALLAEGASLDASSNVVEEEEEAGMTPQQVICNGPGVDPRIKPLVMAAIARHKRLAVLGKEVLKSASWGWDEAGMKSAIAAYQAEVRTPWLGGARLAAELKARPLWTVARKPIDYFREAGTGRTPLLVACAGRGPAGPCFRNIEALIHANSSVMELDSTDQNAHQLYVRAGGFMGKWFEPMWPMWYGGHNPNGAYHRAAKFFLNCCRWSRGRGVEVMHPDDWCIPRHDAYRILTFIGPELAAGKGALWPGPPKGYTGYVPGP